MITDVIIPTCNEEDAITTVIEALPLNLLGEIVVVNNNSGDATYINKITAGVTILQLSYQGYGFACLKGIDYFVRFVRFAKFSL